jgi:nitric oxide dioxygenase
VSNHLHDRVGEGDELELFIPAGEFTLSPSSKPLVLISAGVGITPLMTMLEAAVHSGRPIRFIHCARHAGVQAFAARVDELAAAHPQLQRFYCFDEARPDDGADAHGRLSLERLKAWLPAERDLDAYFLGPKPFMAALKRNLRELGVPEAQTRYEFFGPASALEA